MKARSQVTDSSTPRTIKQALRYVKDHGIDSRILDGLASTGAQQFANMGNDAQISLFERLFCPVEADPSTYIIEPYDVPDQINKIRVHLETLGYKPAVGIHEIREVSSPQPTTSLILPVNSLYTRLIMREIDLTEVLASGVKIYIQQRKLERLAGLVELYILIATGFFEKIASDPDTSYTMMGAMNVPIEVQDALFKWLKKSKMNPYAQSNQYYTLSDLESMFKKLEGLFGKGWAEFIEMMSKYAETIDTSALFGGIGTVDLRGFTGLARLKKGISFVVENIGRQLNQGSLIAGAEDPIKQVADLLTILKDPMLMPYGGGRNSAIEQALFFLGTVANVSPNAYRLAQIAGGFVLAMGLIPPGMEGTIDQELQLSIGAGGMLYGTLFDQVRREADLSGPTSYDFTELWPKQPAQKDDEQPGQNNIVPNPASGQVPEYFGKQDDWQDLSNHLLRLDPRSWETYLISLQAVLGVAGIRYRSDLLNDRIRFLSHYFMDLFRSDVLLLPLGWKHPEWRPYTGELWDNNGLIAHFQTFGTMGMFLPLALAIQKQVTIYAGIAPSSVVISSLVERLCRSYDANTSTWLREMLRARSKEELLQKASGYAGFDIPRWWVSSEPTQPQAQPQTGGQTVTIINNPNSGDGKNRGADGPQLTGIFTAPVYIGYTPPSQPAPPAPVYQAPAPAAPGYNPIIHRGDAPMNLDCNGRDVEIYGRVGNDVNGARNVIIHRGGHVGMNVNASGKVINNGHVGMYVRCSEYDGNGTYGMGVQHR